MTARLLRRGVVGVTAALVIGCGGGADDAQGPAAVPRTDPGPVHVHGLGVNPADGALFVATHTGLFRVGPDEQTATRVGDLHQDTMGFTVVGRDRFLGSGHPDLRSDQPPFLGLIASEDAGRTWEPISLLGEADFHVLESAGRRVVGYGSDFETRRPQLMLSDDGGRSWRRLRPPGALIDLALSPRNSDVWVAAAAERLLRTEDGGRTWSPLGGPPGLLAWDAPGQLFRADGRGVVSVSTDAGETWRTAGEVGGPPAALEATGDELYVALHDGVIKRSTDGGRTWSVRSRPEPTTTIGS